MKTIPLYRITANPGLHLHVEVLPHRHPDGPPAVLGASERIEVDAGRFQAMLIDLSDTARLERLRHLTDQGWHAWGSGLGFEPIAPGPG